MQKADIAISRTAAARDKAEQAEIQAAQACADSQMAVQAVKRYGVFSSADYTSAQVRPALADALGAMPNSSMVDAAGNLVPLSEGFLMLPEVPLRRRLSAYSVIRRNIARTAAQLDQPMGTGFTPSHSIYSSTNTPNPAVNSAGTTGPMLGLMPAVPTAFSPTAARPPSSLASAPLGAHDFSQPGPHLLHQNTSYPAYGSAQDTIGAQSPMSSSAGPASANRFPYPQQTPPTSASTASPHYSFVTHHHPSQVPPPPSSEPSHPSQNGANITQHSNLSVQQQSQQFHPTSLQTQQQRQQMYQQQSQSMHSQHNQTGNPTDGNSPNYSYDTYATDYRSDIGSTLQNKPPQSNDSDYRSALQHQQQQSRSGIGASIPSGSQPHLNRIEMNRYQAQSFDLSSAPNRSDRQTEQMFAHYYGSPSGPVPTSPDVTPLRFGSSVALNQPSQAFGSSSGLRVGPSSPTPGISSSPVTSGGLGLSTAASGSSAQLNSSTVGSSTQRRNWRTASLYRPGTEHAQQAKAATENPALLKRKPSLQLLGSRHGAAGGSTASGTSPVLSREEVSALSSAEREHRRREAELAEKLARNPFLYFVNAHFRNWLAEQQLVLFVMAANLSLVLVFYHFFFKEMSDGQS